MSLRSHRLGDLSDIEEGGLVYVIYKRGNSDSIKLVLVLLCSSLFVAVSFVQENTGECLDDRLSFNSAVSKSTAIFRNWMGSTGNKDDSTLEDCVAPMYRTNKHMSKAIKVSMPLAHE